MIVFKRPISYLILKDARAKIWLPQVDTVIAKGNTRVSQYVLLSYRLPVTICTTAVPSQENNGHLKHVLREVCGFSL